MSNLGLGGAITSRMRRRMTAQALEDLVDETNQGDKVWGDSAYRSALIKFSKKITSKIDLMSVG
ncbi:MAG: hypothetical protein MJA27_31320 [Pseudanabaenales cyanobacterium]|nr:hypothetical protein [Pseudanabaenales cyanobacterium]